MIKSRRFFVEIILSAIILIIFFAGLNVFTKYGMNYAANIIKENRIETLDNFTNILNENLQIDEVTIDALESNNQEIINTVSEKLQKKINEVQTFDFFKEDILNVVIYDNSSDLKLIYKKSNSFEPNHYELNEILDFEKGKLLDSYFASCKEIISNGNLDGEDQVIGYLVIFAGRSNYDIWINRGYIIINILLGLCGIIILYFFLSKVVKINKLQYRDTLTGLYSKKYYKKMIRKMIDKDPRANGELYIIGFRDLYDFEAPNTEIIEEIIVKFAKILKKYKDKNKNVVVFRVSERKLGLYVHKFKSSDRIMENLLGDVEQLLRSKRAYQNIQYYMGIADYPLHEKNVDALVNGAIYALDNLRKGKKQYHIKNYQIYDPTSRKEYVDRQYLYDEVEKIINERRIYSVFQGIVDINKGTIYGYEALSRPISELVPNIGMLISLAAEMGISEDLELILLFIINKTVTDLKDDFRDKNLFINTNVSVKYGDKELNKFKSTIDKITENLVVEITEYSEIDFDTITDKINTIKDFGAKIAIDDFGSGYSNELALLSLKPDIVKIDMGLVRNIDTDERKYQIVDNLIKYAKNNDIKVLAEGVETSGELKVVKELGVDYVQGFIFSKPDKMLINKTFDIDEYIRKNIN